MQDQGAQALKEQLRGQLLPQMRSIALSRRPESARQLLERWKVLGPQVGWVVSFQSLFDEPDLSLLNHHLFEQGRLAWVDWASATPAFVKAAEPDRSIDWRVKPLGAPLPNPLASLILVPAISFTERGEQLGRGVGAYDRLLYTHPNADTLGIGWRSLLQQTLPKDSWDRPVRRLFLIDS